MLLAVVYKYFYQILILCNAMDQYKIDVKIYSIFLHTTRKQYFTRKTQNVYREILFASSQIIFRGIRTCILCNVLPDRGLQKEPNYVTVTIYKVVQI